VLIQLRRFKFAKWLSYGYAEVIASACYNPRETLNKNRLQLTLPAVKLDKGLRKYLWALQVEMEN